MQIWHREVISALLLRTFTSLADGRASVVFSPGPFLGSQFDIDSSRKFVCEN